MDKNSYPVIDMIKTGQNIKQLREKAGLSVSELQEMLGFSTPQAIYKWQWGKTLPDIINLLVMSKLFGVKIEDVLVLKD